MIKQKYLLAGFFAGAIFIPSAHATVLTPADLTDRKSLSIEDAINDGDLGLDLRFRVEHVSVESAKAGNANTLSTRLRYGSSHWRDTAAFLEFVNVTAHANKHFNAGKGINPNRSTRPVIADPKGTSLNKAYIQYEGLDSTVVRLGRQGIVLDNERFVGSDSFRQTPQTYDALTVFNNTHPGIESFYAYVDQVNTRYHGASIPDSSRHNQSHLLNASWNGLPYGDLTGYAYWINDRHDAENSSHTYGIRFTGDSELSGVDVAYTIEMATQQDANNNPSHYKAAYYLAEIGFTLDNFTLTGAHEVMGGDKHGVNARAFRTPMGSTRLHSGWAEMFETMPGAGLVDTKVMFGTNFYDFDFDLQYHRFQPDNANGRFGFEWDFGVSQSFMDGMYQVGLEYARFVGTSASSYTNTNKLWLYASIHI